VSDSTNFFLMIVRFPGILARVKGEAESGLWQFRNGNCQKVKLGATLGFPSICSGTLEDFDARFFKNEESQLA